MTGIRKYFKYNLNPLPYFDFKWELKWRFHAPKPPPILAESLETCYPITVEYHPINPRWAQRKKQ